MSALATVMAHIDRWSADIDTDMSRPEVRRKLSLEGKIVEGDRFCLSGVELNVLVAHIYREYEPDDEFRKRMGIGPQLVLDASPRPLGCATVFASFDILTAHFYPGPSVFDELWTRNMYGGSMPVIIQFHMVGEGASEDGTITWDAEKKPPLPITDLNLHISVPVPPMGSRGRDD